MANPLGTQDPVDIAVFECVIADGIDALTMEGVAERAGVSLSTLFRRYGSRSELISRAHGRAMRLIGWWVPQAGHDRRFELEWWWSTMMEFFAGPWGRAFLAMRPLTADGSGIHAVEQRELALMPDLAKWASVSAPLLRALWSLVITAASPTLDEDERATLRELVYATLTQAAPVDAETDALGEMVALAAPL